MLLNIQFQVICKTQFGQQAVLCGNIPELGQWKPENGLKLQTGLHTFPVWKSKKNLLINNGVTVEFKLCILNKNDELVKWQEINNNRIFSPRTSLVIRFKQSQQNMQCKIMLKRTSMKSMRSIAELPVRKGTEEVINDLASDSSSNRQIWQEHQVINEEETSMMLLHFVSALRRQISMQKEQVLHFPDSDIQVQGHENLIIGNYYNHQNRKNILIVPSDQFLIEKNNYLVGQKIQIYNFEELHSCKIEVSDQLTVLHILVDQSMALHSIQKLKQLILNNKKQIYLIVCHALFSMNKILLELNFIGVNVIIFSEQQQASQLIELLYLKKYCVQGYSKNQFLVYDHSKMIMKIIISNTMKQQFNSQPRIPITRMLPTIVENFSFAYKEAESRTKIRNQFPTIRSFECHCLIIIHLVNFDQIPQKILGDLIQLSSFKYDTWISILIEQKLPTNIKQIVPLERNRMIVVSTQGQIYTNGDIVNIHDHLEISMDKFLQNIYIIVQSVGFGIQRKSRMNPINRVLYFPDNSYGEILQKWIIKVVRDINKKSLAKISVIREKNKIELIPFIYHPAFLLNIFKDMFIRRLKSNQRGMIFCLQSRNIQLLQQEQLQQTQDIAVDVANFILSDDKSGYRKSPLNNQNLQTIINIIADVEELKIKESQEIAEK